MVSSWRNHLQKNHECGIGNKPLVSIFYGVNETLPIGEIGREKEKTIIT
jgi:hypothetical protein